MVEGNKNKVKLLICYHKPAYLLKDNVMTPIHVGRANAKVRMGEENPDYQWLVNNMIGDDTGENISNKNDYYNEMPSVMHQSNIIRITQLFIVLPCPIYSRHFIVIIILI